MSKANGQAAPLATLPNWMMAMRQAAMDAISEKDVKAIVRSQIDKAKQGDRNALRFVFDYVLGGQQMRGATFVQNNNYGDASPNQPTTARPGTTRKLGAMRRRAEAGLPLTADDDGPEVDLT